MFYLAGMSLGLKLHYLSYFSYLIWELVINLGLFTSLDFWSKITCFELELYLLLIWGLKVHLVSYLDYDSFLADNTLERVNYPCIINKSSVDFSSASDINLLRYFWHKLEETYNILGRNVGFYTLGFRMYFTFSFDILL